MGSVVIFKSFSYRPVGDRLHVLQGVAGAVVRANGAIGRDRGSVASFIVLSCVCHYISRRGSISACVVCAKSKRFRSIIGCLVRGRGGIIVCTVEKDYDNRLRQVTARLELAAISRRCRGTVFATVTEGVGCIRGGPKVVPAYHSATSAVTVNGGCRESRLMATVGHVLRTNCLCRRETGFNNGAMGILHTS